MHASKGPSWAKSYVAVTACVFFAAVGFICYPIGLSLAQQPLAVEIQRTPPLQAQRLRLNPQPVPRQIEEHDPAEPARPVPVGPLRPWGSSGSPTSPQGIRSQSARPPSSGIITDSTDPLLLVSSVLQPNLWETNAASSGDVVLFTGNWNDAFSLDGGKTFAELNPFAMLSGFPAGFCCDQVVQYVPKIDRFIWVLQAKADPSTNENEYRIAFASPESIKANRASVWNYYNLTPKQLNFPGFYYDYPEIAVGDSYLYISFNVVGAGKAVIARIPLTSFLTNATGTSAPAEFIPIADGWWIRPVQNVGRRDFSLGN
jgi:hypothetical protein